MQQFFASPEEQEVGPIPTVRDGSAWRKEVSERLDKYQTRRRPREPRYPSLQLKFEISPDSTISDEVDKRHRPPRMASVAEPLPRPVVGENLHPGSSVPETVPSVVGRVIAFPRTTTIPALPLDELAGPVLDRPRIMEAVDVPVSEPSLGGIVIEPMETPANERRPGFEMPLQSAPMLRRLGATTADAAIVSSAVSIFAYLFWRIELSVPPLQIAAGIVAVIAGTLWMGYQYLFFVHCGTTPGLKLAKLSLARFDGTPVPRRIRRWRVFASILSALSLGLGYLWCFLDEDQLCWHDRITRTHMAPKPEL